MNKVIIDGKTYSFPSVIEGQYDNLYISEVTTGAEDFDRLGDDFLESELFSVYASSVGIEEDDADISAVRNSVFAYYSDGEDYSIILLKEEQ